LKKVILSRIRDHDFIVTISEQVHLKWDWKLERIQTSGYCFAKEKKEFFNF